uniref:Uncharacterized protein n=1 Tax=Anopheles arabiensis TaxID=7173 RepID=A0A182IEZ0_ANOAR
MKGRTRREGRQDGYVCIPVFGSVNCVGMYICMCEYESEIKSISMCRMDK